MSATDGTTVTRQSGTDYWEVREPGKPAVVVREHPGGTIRVPLDAPCHDPERLAAAVARHFGTAYEYREESVGRVAGCPDAAVNWEQYYAVPTR